MAPTPRKPAKRKRTSSSAKKSKPAEKQRSNKGLQNLKMWKPGQSGNPAGRPKKGMTISDCMRDILAGTEISVTMKQPRKKPVTYEVSSNRNLGYAVAAAAIMRAVKGDVLAIKEVCDRVQGKPHQSIGLTPEVPRETPLPDSVLAELADKARAARGE